jgi:hypothetical protein
MTDLTVTLPTLHAGQLRRREKVNTAKARFVLTMCGRRWGKTMDGEEWVADGALDGQRCGWFSPTYKYQIEVWDSLVFRLRSAIRTQNKTDKRIELITGGIIECWTLDTPDAGRSRKYHRIVVDEAGIVPNLQTIWQQALRPTLTDYRGHAWFYGTPKGRTHDFSVMFAKGEAEEPGWMSHRAPTRENPYIPQDEIEAARRDMPAAAYQQEYEGIPADDGGNPFGITAIREAVADKSVNPPVVWGWDFARAQDWTVGIGLDAYGFVTALERWQGKPWDWTKRRVETLTHRTSCVGDSTGIGDVIVESIQQLGVPMHGFMFTPKSKQALMERLAVAIQSKHIHFPKTEEFAVLVSELETFTYEYTAHGVRYTAPDGLHDDAVMALALAVYGWDRLGVQVPAMAIPQQEDIRDVQRWQPLVGVGERGDPEPDFGGLGRGW